jgi:trk system potassium uptake protein TrkH
VEHDPRKIVRDIIIFTVLVESLGAFALYAAFNSAGVRHSSFNAIFHSISAFCNAGFSPFPDSLERFKTEPAVLLIVSSLIVTGGIGFIVMQDLVQTIVGKRKTLSYHTKLILISTFILVAVGAMAFWFMEGANTFAGMGILDRAANALFQSITPRTAGFNAVHQTSLRQSSKFITMILMFIGGAPGSIAGGIKIATAYIVMLVMLKRANEWGEINAFGKRISRETINAAVVYFIKAILLLIFAVGVLSLLEGPRGADLGQIGFEVVSAFGTVGLSLDFTSNLSLYGKLVIIITMFAGRVGLLAFVFLGNPAGSENFVYPEAEILIG